MTKKKKPEVYDFDHEDGLASQMTDEQIDKAADSLKKLMDEKIKKDPELRKKIESLKKDLDGREKSMMRISVDYGYDTHSIEISDEELKDIQLGKKLEIEGRGFPVEGEMENDWWKFNTVEQGSIEVCGEEGRQIYLGNLINEEVSVAIS